MNKVNEDTKNKDFWEWFDTSGLFAGQSLGFFHKHNKDFDLIVDYVSSIKDKKISELEKELKRIEWNYQPEYVDELLSNHKKAITALKEIYAPSTEIEKLTYEDVHNSSDNYHEAVYQSTRNRRMIAGNVLKEIGELE